MRVQRKSGPWTRAFLVLLAICGSWGFCPLAAAQPEPVHIDYQAAADCPSEPAFLRSLQKRTTRFSLAEAAQQARWFMVHVAPVNDGFAGHLEVRGVDGNSALRSVEASLCTEVVDALALMTALAIDPNALTEPAAAQPAAPAVKPPPPPVPAPPPVPWQWSAGLAGHGTFRVSPSTGYGADLFVDAEAPASSALGPSLRLGVLFNQSDVTLSTGAAARFQWMAASLEGCPARLPLLGRRLVVHPCVALHLGALRGEGEKISDPRHALSLWADAAPTLRLRLWVTPRLIVEGQAAFVVPLRRPVFEISDMGTPATAYAVPGFGVCAGIGVAYRFR